MEGVENTERLLDRLTAAMARFQEQLERVYRQQRERDEARRLREEQVHDAVFEVFCESYVKQVFEILDCRLSLLLPKVLSRYRRGGLRGIGPAFWFTWTSMPHIERRRTTTF